MNQFLLVRLKTKNLSSFFHRKCFSFALLNDLKNLEWKHAYFSIESCYTPPSSWYTNKIFYEEVEKKVTFPSSWILVGHTKDLVNEGDYIAGNILGQNPWVVVNTGTNARNDVGDNNSSNILNLKAYRNVCRHHAAQIVDDGIGNLNDETTNNLALAKTYLGNTVTSRHSSVIFRKADSATDNNITASISTNTNQSTSTKTIKKPIRFKCPYHGWQYTLDGKLSKATQMKGSSCFKASENGLLPILVDHVGPWIFIRLNSKESKGSLLADQPDMSTFFSHLSINTIGQHEDDSNTDDSSNTSENNSSSNKDNSSINSIANNLTNLNSHSLNTNNSSDTIKSNSARDAITTANEDFNNLVHIQSKSYTIKCNYKVYLDNYLDGGYHVSVAHPELADSLNMKSYKNIGGYDNFFVQTCESKQQQQSSVSTSLSSSSSSVPFNRLSSNSSNISRSTHTTSATTTKPAKYLFHYPNLCINRYGQWMDINRVFPIDINTCIVYFDWYVDKSHVHDSEYLTQCLAESERVQLEDMWLCERVQKGLQSQVFEKAGGVYAPLLETGAYMYHQRLHQDYLTAAKAITAT